MQIFLVAAILLCAIQAIRATRLLAAALWLAGVSALLSTLLYLLEAPIIAAIELSVGAGLVTVLFVFAINIAGEQAGPFRALVPHPLAWGLVLLVVLLLGWLSLPLAGLSLPISEPAFAAVLWEQRGVDMLVQIVLIFSGVLGVLGLLAEIKSPAGEVSPVQQVEIPEVEPPVVEPASPEPVLEEVHA